MAWLLTGALLAPACGGFVASDATIARQTFDARGGELQFESLSMTVAAGSLDRSVTLSVHRAAFEAVVGHAYSVEPAGTTFPASALAVVAIAYDQIAFPHPVNMFVAAFDGAEWHPLPRQPGTEMNVGRAHGLTAHAGIFGLVSCPGVACATTSADGGSDH